MANNVLTNILMKKLLIVHSKILLCTTRYATVLATTLTVVSASLSYTYEYCKYDYFNRA